jgi:DNA-binding NtrC family response regulator
MDEMDTFDVKAIGRSAGEKAEKEWIQQVLVETRWNRKKAARLLQVSYKTLLFKITKYRLNSVSPIYKGRLKNVTG